MAGPPKLLGSTLPRSYARVDVGNAIAAIEGKVALDYLIKHNTFNIIDANHDGLITSQEIQNFVDNAHAMGLPEAGAMARLLGGTARSAIDQRFTLTGETPDQPDVLQRRFNFFDYAVHGKLQGSISITQFKLLSKYILPLPDAYTITDRQRASGNGFLIAPTAQRNFKDLQHLQPGYEFVPKGAYVRYNGTSPGQFGVNRNQKPGAGVGPVYSLFGVSGAETVSSKVPNSVTNAPTAAATPAIAASVVTTTPVVATPVATAAPVATIAPVVATPVATAAPVTTIAPVVATPVATAAPVAAITPVVATPAATAAPVTTIAPVVATPAVAAPVTPAATTTTSTSASAADAATTTAAKIKALARARGLSIGAATTEYNAEVAAAQASSSNGSNAINTGGLPLQSTTTLGTVAGAAAAVPSTNSTRPLTTTTATDLAAANAGSTATTTASSSTSDNSASAIAAAIESLVQSGNGGTGTTTKS